MTVSFTSGHGPSGPMGAARTVEMKAATIKETFMMVVVVMV